MLAASWTKPCPVEEIMVQFWPEVDQNRARKNLSYTLTQLREAFEESQVDFDELVLRTRHDLAFNPDRLGTHDYIELTLMVRDHKPITSMATLERLFRLNQGHFLPGVFEPWAQDRRTELETHLTQTLLATAEHALSSSLFEIADKAAKALLVDDPLDQEAARLVMETALARAQPREATEFFESFSLKLRNEQEEPDTELLKLFHRARLGL